MRKIRFSGYPRALSFALWALISGLAILLILQFVFSLDQSLPMYGGVILNAVFQYFVSLRNSESHLTADQNDIYLHNIPAALKHRFPTLGRSHIRVTSLTKNGYHRIKVYENWVSGDDWQLLLSKCT